MLSKIKHLSKIEVDFYLLKHAILFGIDVILCVIFFYLIWVDLQLLLQNVCGSLFFFMLCITVIPLPLTVMCLGLQFMPFGLY